MITTIDIQELPARLEEALALAASGGEVILTEGAVPRARIVHVQVAHHVIRRGHRDPSMKPAAIVAALAPAGRGCLGPGPGC